MIVNDPGSDQKMAERGRVYDETTFNMEAPLDKGKGKDRAWFEQDEIAETLSPKHTVNDQYLDQDEEEEDLPPRYSSIHPQHRARVQAWREESSEPHNPIA